MIRYSYLLIYLSSVIIASCSTQSFVEGNIYREQNADFRNKKFAILDFQPFTPDRTEGRYVSDMLTIELLFNEFQVIERDYINDILGEQALQVSGAVTDTQQKERLKQIGQLLGVDCIMVGAVSFYGYDYLKTKAVVGITARLIDVETGRVLWAMGANKRDSSIQAAMQGVSLAVTESLKGGKVYAWEK